MRLVVVVLLIIAVIVAIFLNLSYDKNMVTIHKGNISMQPVDIDLGHYQDSFCGMVIDDIKYTSEVVVPDGRTWFFHDHGVFVEWLKDKPFKDEATIWVMTKDTKKYINGRAAWYSRTDITPMSYGFGAYQKKQKADFTPPFDRLALVEFVGVWVGLHHCPIFLHHIT